MTSSSIGVGRIYAACVASALSDLHGRGWIYRDIKAENIVFARNGYVKLVDFGVARRLGPGRLYTNCGSVEYMAPEVVRQTGYGASADWWSFGCLVYEMIIGHTPWMLGADGVHSESLTDAEVSANMLTRPLAYPSASSSANTSPARPPSTAAQSLLSGLLERNPARRLGGSNDGSAAVTGHAWCAESPRVSHLCASTFLSGCAHARVCPCVGLLTSTGQSWWRGEPRCRRCQR